MLYPEAPRGTVVDDFNGTKVADPYRWLEELDAPATRAWVARESALTEAYLGGLPGRDALVGGSARSTVSNARSAVRGGAAPLYAHNNGLQNQSVLFKTEGLNGAPGVVLDLTRCPRTAASRSSAMSQARTAACSPMVSPYPGLTGPTGTCANSRPATTARRDPPREILSAELREGWPGALLQCLPAPPPGAELSAKESATPSISTRSARRPLPTASSSSRRSPRLAVRTDGVRGRPLARCHLGRGEVGDKGVENLYLIDLASPAPTVTPVSDGFRAAYIYVGADAGRLYFLTTLDAPNGKVIAVDPTAARVTTAVAEGPDAIELTEPPSTPSVSLVDHQLIVQTLHDAHSRVAIYGLDGKLRHEVTLPGAGTVDGFSGRAGDKRTFYSFTDLVTPRAIYLLDLASGSSTLYRAPKVAFDRNTFEEKQVFYPGKDGTRIPMLLAYRKGLKLDGTNPVLLYGYGGFGIPVLPHFGPAKIAWLERAGSMRSPTSGAVASMARPGTSRRTARTSRSCSMTSSGPVEWLIEQRYTGPRSSRSSGSTAGCWSAPASRNAPSFGGGDRQWSA